MTDPWPGGSIAGPGGLSAAPFSGGTQAPPAWPGGPRYQRLGLVGEGGMGRVLLGYDAWLNRNVALKFPLGEVGSPSDHALRREANLAARLDHPSIVAVHDVGEDEEGRPFFVMRWLEGRPLHAVLAAGERGPALRALRVAAEAVGHAHSRRVVHRDLSPANIVIGEHEQVGVIDWGLAAEAGDADATRRVGTPGYAAPEQMNGASPDPSADVWSLGTLLAQIVGPRPPPELAAIIGRATAADPSARYPTGAHLANDLLAWENGRLVEAYSYSPRELAGRLVWRWRWPLAVAGVGALALVGLGAWSAVRITRERDLAVRALARSEAEQALAAWRLGDDHRAAALARAALTVAPDPLAAGVRAAAPQAIDRAGVVRHAETLPACPRWEPVRPEGWLCLEEHQLRLFVGGEWAWTDPSRVHSVRQRGPHLFVVHPERHQRTLDAQTGRLLDTDPRLGEFVSGEGPWRLDLDRNAPLTPDLAPFTCPRHWLTALRADDGASWIACRDGSVWRVDGAGAALHRSAHPDLIDHLAADGARIWASTHRGEVIALTGAPVVGALGQPTRQLLPVQGGILAVGRAGRTRWWSADGRVQVDLPAPDGPAAVAEDGALRWVRAGQAERFTGLFDAWARWQGDAGLTAASFTADGLALRAADGGGDVHFLPLNPQQPNHTMRWQQRVVKDVQSLADGGWLAGAMGTSGVAAFDAQDRPILMPDKTDQRYRRVARLHTGEVVAIGYGWDVHVWANGRLRTMLPGSTPHQLAITHDQGALVIVGRERVWAWDGVSEPAVVAQGVWDFAAYDLGKLALARQNDVWVDGRTWATEAPVTATLWWGPERLVLGRLDGVVEVRAPDGTLLQTLPAHSDRVSGLALSPDRRRLASAGWDGRLVLHQGE